MRINWLKILIVMGLAVSFVGLSGCSSSQKGYYELQREALNQDKKKECTMKDVTKYIVGEAVCQTIYITTNNLLNDLNK
jgi:hypothetical protein